MLNEKLDSLVRALNEESLALLNPSPRNLHPDSALKENGKELNEKDDVAKMFQSKEQLMLRANSLKKALKQIIEQAEKGKTYLNGFQFDFTQGSLTNHIILLYSNVVVDEQNKQTQVFSNPATSPNLKESSEDFNKELERMGKITCYFRVDLLCALCCPI